MGSVMCSLTGDLERVLGRRTERGGMKIGLSCALLVEGVTWDRGEDARGGCGSREA